MKSYKINHGERYRIEFQGQITKQFTKEEVINSLSSLFKTEREKAGILFDGKRRILKSNLNWQSAMDYHSALIGYGALCDIKVILDETNLKKSLVPIEDLQSTLSDITNKSESTADKPLVFSSDSERFFSELLIDDSGEKSNVVDSLKAALNSRTKYTFEFKGEYYREYSGRKVMNQFAELFDSDVKNVEELFLGKLYFVKKDLNYFTASQYLEIFINIGAYCTTNKQDEFEKLTETTEIPIYIITCPKCGNQQEGGEECEACGIYFEKYLAMQNRKKTEKMLVDIEAKHKVEKDSDIIAAKTGNRLGGIILISAFLIDLLMQKRGIDIGYLPYFLSSLTFAYGCWFLARARGYPAYVGLIGLTNILGLAVISLLPDKTKPLRPFQFTFPAIAVIMVIFTAAYWNIEYQTKKRNFDAFTLHSNTLGHTRHQYPVQVLDSDPELFTDQIDLVGENISSGFSLLKTNKYRPDKIKTITNRIFDNLAGLFIWIQYQQYLHLKLKNELPEHLRDDHVKKIKLKFKVQFEDFIKKNKFLESNSSFKHIYYQWNGGCYKWNLLKDTCAGMDPQVNAFNKELFHFNEYFRIRRTIKMYDSKKVNYRVKSPDIPRIKKRIVSSAKIVNNTAVELQIARGYNKGMSGKSLVMAFYILPNHQPGKSSQSLIFTQIGGNLPNKYLEQYSVFYNWKEKDE